MTRPLWSLLPLLGCGLSSVAFAQATFDAAVLGASSRPQWNADVAGLILAAQNDRPVRPVEIATLDVYDVAGAALPPDLTRYAAVLVFTEDVPFGDPVGLGNQLADFADQGGGVVLMGRVFVPGFELQGRWPNTRYSPLTVNGRPSQVPDASLELVLQPLEAASSSLQWVRWAYAGTKSPHVVGTSVINSAVRVADWSNGEPAVVERRVLARGSTVALNFSAVSDREILGHWKSVSDGGQLLLSSLLVAAEATPLCANTTLRRDINCNTIDATPEGLVDFLPLPLPVGVTDNCRVWYDARGYINRDDYFQYGSFRCAVPILEIPPPPMMPPPDADNDGFVRHDAIPVPRSTSGGAGVGVAALTCDNCPTDANPDQRDADCDAIGDVCDLCPTIPDPLMDPLMQADFDMDMVGDVCDNCPPNPADPAGSINPDQSDRDRDTIGDTCDNCPDVYNPDQADSDGDGLGNACDNCPTVPTTDQTDSDGDGAGDACDVCPDLADPEQRDSDGDGYGDLCDVCPFIEDVVIDTKPPERSICNDAGYTNIRFGRIEDTLVTVCQLDSDDDGLGDVCDNCPLQTNPLQQDADLDGRGNACDNCPSDANDNQNDQDFDGVGDACDVSPTVPDPLQRDLDRDSVGNPIDNCPEVFNVEQRDRDGDGIGDVCDVCPLVPDADQLDSDDDGVGDACDNCPDLPNTAQEDIDANGVGDICDLQVRGGGEDTACSHAGPRPVGGILLVMLAGALRRRRVA